MGVRQIADAPSGLPPDAAGGRETTSPRRDPFVWASAGLLALCIAFHAHSAGQEAGSWWGVYFWYLAFQAIVLVAVGLEILCSTRAARVFWARFGSGFALWTFFSSVYPLTAPWRDDLLFQTSVDLLFLVSYLCFVFAAEVRPEQRDPSLGSGNLDRRIEAGSLLVLSLFLAGFFVVVPNVFGPIMSTSGMTLESYFLYLAFDLYLGARFLYLAQGAPPGSWRTTYRLSALAFGFFCISDSLEILFHQPPAGWRLPEWTDPIWFVGFVPATAAVRAARWSAPGVAAGTGTIQAAVRRSRRIGLYFSSVCALVVGFDLLGLDSGISRPRALLGVVTAIVLALLARLQMRFLDDRATTLYEERREAVESQRKVAGSLEETVRERTREIEETRTVALGTLARLAETRDPSPGRLDRVAELSARLARRFREENPDLEGISGGFEEEIRRSSALLDIGLVGVPDEILLRDGALTAEERAIVETHPTRGGDALRSVIEEAGGESFLRTAMNVAYHHHERWDGSGYPEGLAGEAIPLAARIVAVVDSYDAMTRDRPYRKALAHEQAVGRIRHGRGSDFDPAIVDAFLSIADGLQAEGPMEFGAVER